MTNEEQLADLKQFIATTISQQTAHLASKADLVDLERRMTKRMDEQFAAIADTLTEVVEALDAAEELEDHARRLVRLEQRTA